MLVLLLYKDRSSSRHRHKSCLDCRGGKCVKLIRKTRYVRPSQYNFYKHIYYFGVLLVSWHCFCNSLYSGWVTGIELHVQLSTTWVGPLYLYWSIDFTDISLRPCQQHFAHGPHRFLALCSASDITPIKQLSYNPTRLFYNMDLVVIRRGIPTADTEKPFQAGEQVAQRGGAVPILEGFQDLTGQSPE